MAYHAKHMQEARDLLATKFPSFQFRGFLMDIDGSVREIQIDNRKSLFMGPQKTENDNFLAGITESFGLTDQRPFPQNIGMHGPPIPPPMPQHSIQQTPNGLRIGHN